MPAGKARVRALVLLVAAILCGAPAAGPAWSLAVSVSIDQPLPERFAARWKTFLERLGLVHIDAALQGTKTVGPIPEDAEFFIFRVEHAESCFDGRCLTVIGRIEPDVLVPQLMFMANGAYVQGDVVGNLWGTRSTAMLFPSGEAMLSVVRSAQGWFLVPEKNTLPPDIDSPRPRPPAVPPPPRQVERPGFEGFRQALEGLR